MFIGDPEELQEVARRPRRWTYPSPPSPMVRAFDGEEILSELVGSEALCIWQVYRDALLWHGAQENERPGLFVGATAAHGWSDGVTVFAPVRAVVRALERHVRTPRADPRAVAKLCSSVGSWAGSAGFLDTQSLFSCLAANIRPRSRRLAVAAGRAERVAGRHERAVQWFQRAIGLSRRAGDEATYASAYMSWGLLERSRNRSAAARSMYQRAWRAAERAGIRDLVARARHNLIALTEYNDFAEGQAHIEAACRLYGRTNPSMARLAADAACFWTWHGHFSTALPLYVAALSRISSRPDRAQVLANSARAAAALGMAAPYGAALRELQGVELAYDFSARVWVDLAEGARSLGRLRLALDLTGRALEAANASGEALVEVAARGVLSAIQRDQLCDADAPAPARLRRFAERLERIVGDLPEVVVNHPSR